MRLPAVLVPAVLLLAGALFFVAKTRENLSRREDSKPLDPPAAALAVGSLDDEYDLALIRRLLQIPDLDERQANTLLGAAGRRYVRRKTAYAAAKRAADAGSGAPSRLDPLLREMEAARKVCDVAESLGRRDRELAAANQADWELERRLAYIPSAMVGLTERYDGAGTFTSVDLATMEQDFFKQFGRPMPVSARGESAVHRAMGFDHAGRFDLALSPWQPEGAWARRYLTGKHFTFLAFGSAVPGKATGAHIHIGPPSPRRTPGN